MNYNMRVGACSLSTYYSSFFIGRTPVMNKLAYALYANL